MYYCDVKEKKQTSPPHVDGEDVLVAKVYSTTNYEKFKFLDENRKTDHVKALANSFRKRDVPNAILCNEKFEIIDGQNRFLARKELGLPILYYCISGLDIYDVAFLNSYGKNWKPEDFVSMWAALGKEEYKKILQFREEFQDLSLPSAIMVLKDSSSTMQSVGSDKYFEKNRRGASYGDPIKEGRFVVKDIEHARFVARSIIQYKPFSRPGLQIYKQAAFVSAMIQLLRKENFDNSEMVKRAGLYPTLFYRCVNAKEYIVMLEKLWNYGRRKKIHFDYQ